MIGFQGWTVAYADIRDMGCNEMIVQMFLIFQAQGVRAPKTLEVSPNQDDACTDLRVKNGFFKAG